MKNRPKIRIEFVSFAIVLLFHLLSCDKFSGSSELKLFPVRGTSEFQYVDSDGKIIINPQFNIATIFKDGLALVKSSGTDPKWGYISEDGKYTIMPNYLYATVFSENIAWVVSSNSAPTAINTKGEELFKLTDASSVKTFHEGLAAYSIRSEEGIKWGFVDKKGNVKINPQFMEVKGFSGGKCAVMNSERKWGYIDSEGNITINYQFEDAQDFLNDRAIILFNGKYGVINEHGKYVINPQFSKMIPDEDIYIFKSDSKWGWCDKEGKIQINPQFNSVGRFNGNKMAPVQSDGKWGYVNEEGKYEINPQFDFALPFVGKIAIVLSSGSYGFIDEKGKFSVNPQFSGISSDLQDYLLMGNSQYYFVNSDYFDVTGIVNRINYNSPEGLTNNSTVKDVIQIMQNKNTSESSVGSDGSGNEYYKQKFSMHENVHSVFKEQISEEVSIEFMVIATPYKRTSYSYIGASYDFDPDAQIQGFSYTISFVGKSISKLSEVHNALVERLGEEYPVGRSGNIFKGKDNNIIVNHQRNAISCFITRSYDNYNSTNHMNRYDREYE